MSWDVVAPHPQRVPRFVDAIVRGVAVDECVDDLRVGGIAGVHAVDAEVVPHGREAAEDLVAGERPAAVDPLGLRRREQYGHVVAGLTMAGGEDPALGRLPEHPVAGRVAGSMEVGAEADEVVVHVHRDSGRRSDVGDTTLKTVDLGERQSETAELDGQGRQEVAAVAQLLEVVDEELVVAVVAGGPLVEALQHLVGEEADGLGVRCGRHAMRRYGSATART